MSWKVFDGNGALKIALDLGSTNIVVVNLGTLDITGLTTADISAAINPIIPQNTLYAFVKLTSTNGTENINLIESLPILIPVRFFIGSALVVTFVSGTSVPNNPRVSAGLNTEVGNVANEWIEFAKINGVVLETSRGIYSI